MALPLGVSLQVQFTDKKKEKKTPDTTEKAIKQINIIYQCKGHLNVFHMNSFLTQSI